MISLLIGIFLVILFIVTIVLSVSTWRAWHTVAACMTFLAAVGLVIVGSLSLKTHNYWRKTHADVSQQLTDAGHEGLVLEHGDPTLVEITDAFGRRRATSTEPFTAGSCTCVASLHSGSTCEQRRSSIDGAADGNRSARRSQYGQTQRHSGQHGALCIPGR